jgi:hypothetical protein
LLIKLLGHGTIIKSNFNGTLYNETKDSDLPCHTMDPQGRRARWSGLGGVGRGDEPKIYLHNESLFKPPLFKTVDWAYL